jgi:hypothetical protein
MGDNVFVFRSVGPESADFVPGKKIAPWVSGWRRLPVGYENKPRGVDPVRRRLPISTWQTHSWTKKIIEAEVRPGGAEKARTPRRVRG